MTTDVPPPHAPPGPATAGLDLFARDNLFAWCIVPFDGRRRGPDDRAAMLADLGLRRLVWDWRDEHLSSFEAELEALAGHGIDLAGVWMPARLGADRLDDAGEFLVDVLRRRGVRTDLWVCTEYGEPGRPAVLPPPARAERARLHARAVLPVARAARELGGRVGLYNHLGWFGEPENQLEVADHLAALGYEEVGLVYNQHHGHAHVDRFADLLDRTAPRLIAVNLNGTVRRGDLEGRKIVPVGHGELDAQLLGALAASGWRGPVGLIGHTDDDARDRLLDNLEGLERVVAELRGDRAADAPLPVARAPH